jgi:hypothetical protein
VRCTETTGPEATTASPEPSAGAAAGRDTHEASAMLKPTTKHRVTA